MTQLTPMKKRPAAAGFKKGDVLVLFGELFSRGYANGIVDEAQKLGMRIVYSTVGRRTPEGELRALNEEELAQAPQPFINIPLEAGYDLDPSRAGTTPVDQLKGVKMNEFAEAKMDFAQLEESKQAGRKRFHDNVEKYLVELKKHIPQGANVLFVHIMAGGVPRAKIYMPTMNKVFKGRGDRFESSEKFLSSDMGKFAADNFNEVTADTFKTLVELSSPLRREVESAGGRVRYVAYGYHGTEVLIRGEYRWQTYTPYFQGWAKMRLEKWAEEFWKKDIACTVYNCPEILTNSSSVFQGVEVSLYPLLGALQKDGGHSPRVQNVLKEARELLKPEHTVDEVLKFTDEYLTNPLTLRFTNYANWPGHNAAEQMGYMLESSDHLIEMHKDPKNLITALLSEQVFQATGTLMLHDAWEPQHPVVWLGHDIIAQDLAARS